MLPHVLVLAGLYVSYIVAHLLLAVFRAQERLHEALCLAYVVVTTCTIVYILNFSIPITVLLIFALYFTAELSLLVPRYRNEIKFVSHVLLGSLFTLYAACILARDVVSLYALWAISSVLIVGLLARSRTIEALDASVRYIVYSSMGLAVLTLAMSCLGLSTRLSLSVLTSLGLVCLVLGVLYELGIVPMHFWVPDVYLRSDKLAVAYLASHMQIIAGIVLARLLPPLLCLQLPGTAIQALAIISAVTMTLGNVCGLGSDREEHILAFSSVANAGYVLAALTCGLRSVKTLPLGLSVALYLIIAASLSKYILFTLLPLPLEERGKLYNTEVLINILSLIGVPPLLGFWPKLLLFLIILRAKLLWLAVLLIVNIAMSIVYYIRLYSMYKRGTGDMINKKNVKVSIVGGFIGTILVIILGLILNVWFCEALTGLTGNSVFLKY